uniref:WRKY domain-containing protein n=1 Tax=Oryza brachyantha TaxID=4533 RepID=J3M859_ORYBR
MALIATGATPAASVASELIAQGRESAAALEALLQGASLPPAHGGLQSLAAEILRCCDRALAVMRGDEAESSTGGGAAAACGVKRKTAAAQATRKRRVGGGGAAPATRVETARTSEDGFLWRKYGQKDIKNSKHPRLYFRCSYKEDDGCKATRQVQQSEDDPSLYVITYFGEHTCSGKTAAAAVDDVDDDDAASSRHFVINFGSATASSGAPPLLYSSDSNGGVLSETTLSSSPPQSMRSPEQDREDSGVMMTKEEPVDSRPASAGSSPADDASCASLAMEPLIDNLNWDKFGDSSFVDIDEFMNFGEIDLFQI